MKYSKGFLALVFLIGLLAGGIGGAVVGAIMSVATIRGIEPPLLGAFIPTLTPTATWTSTPAPTATATSTLTVTPSPSTTPTSSPTALPTVTPTNTFTPQPTLMDMIEEVEPSVVTIAASVQGSDEPQAFGSGWRFLKLALL